MGQKRAISPPQGGRVLTVTSEKGGSGKTTLSVILAAYAVAAGDFKRVLLIDADPRQISSGWHAIASSRGDAQQLPDVIAARSGLARTIDRQRQHYDLVVVDTAPADCAGGPLDRIVADSINAATLVVVPVCPGLDVWGLATLARRIGSRPSLYVLNQYNPRIRGDREVKKALEEGNLRVARTTLARRAIFRTSLLHGSTPTLEESTRPSHVNASSEICDLWGEIARMGVKNAHAA